MLIPDCWYAVLDARAVTALRPLAARRFGRDLVFWRDGAGQVSAFEDRCPHRSSQLSLGKVVAGRIQCPFHGFEFDADGACQFVPANGRAAQVPKVFRCESYPVREAHGFIWVWYGRRRDVYPPLSWFADLDGFEYATTSKEWEVDVSRAIEGLLDVSHLPFVHARTIGRGRKTLVNGPYTTLEDDVIRVWVSNQPDQGLPALKPTQVPPPEGPASLEFRYPNIWILRISAKFRVVNVIAPIEEGRCLIYLRTYLKMAGPPALARMAGRVANVLNLRILAEDYPVIQSQRPRVTDLEIGEHFIPADRPIAIYLQRRREMIEASARVAGRDSFTEPVGMVR
jgi:phenylpropionate dioxygenase-like ring-hydroxylating dioxygenase large terminal subunit